MLILLKQALIGQSMRRTRVYLSETAQTSVLRDTFVAHDGAETDTQAKLIRIPCSAINVHKLENVFAMLGENEIAAVDELFNENIEPVEETRVNCFYGQRQR